MRAVVSGVWVDKRLGEEANEKAKWADSGHGHRMGRGRDLLDGQETDRQAGAVTATSQSSSEERTPGEGGWAVEAAWTLNPEWPW